MTTSQHFFMRGGIWTWRRRWPGFSTKIGHLQLSLRTADRSVARMIASRLTYESDRMFDAIKLGDLTPDQAKTWLENVVRTELVRIERQRHIARLDPVGTTDEDRCLDWGAARAWQLMASRGLGGAVSNGEAERLKAEGASSGELAGLATMLDLLSRDLGSDSGVRKMIAQARNAIPAAFSAERPPSAETILQLRQLLTAGNSAAWQAAETMPDPHLDWALGFAKQLTEGPRLPAAFDPSEPPDHAPPRPAAPTPLPVSSPPASSALAPDRFSFDPHLLTVVERINADGDRAMMKPETQRQLVANAKLFIAVTGIETVTEIDQRHLKYYKSVLQRLPKSYGKSAKDAERTIDEVLARAAQLPPEEVGLSPSTINGHLDRFSLILRYARSERLAIAPDIQLDLLRVPETKRARDKRDALTQAELTRVFAHPIWTGCANPKRRHQPGKLIVKDGLYWIPLMAAYSGARREEVAALMPEDFAIIDGIACYHLRDNAFRSVKTFSSERTVPIHDHLIQLGLLDHVARMRKRKERAIFPELVPTNASTSFGDRIFYNWSKALEIQLDGNPSKLCFHSFRHAVITTLKREKAVTAKERRDLVGHVGADAHDEVYDTATSMPDMKKVVDRLSRVF